MGITLPSGLSDSPSPNNKYYVAPILGVFSNNFPTTTGDRYIDSSDPTVIKVVGSADQPFPDGAVVAVLESDRLYKRNGNDLSYYLPYIIDLFFQTGVYDDLAIEQQTFGLNFNRIIQPPLAGGSINLQQGWFNSTRDQTALVEVNLNFAPRNNSPTPKKEIFWQSSVDNGATWQDLPVIISSYDEGRIRQFTQTEFLAGRIYRLAVTLSLPPTIEDILLEDSYLNVGVKDARVAQVIEDFDGAIAPIVAQPTFIDLGNETFDITYEIQLQSELTSLDISLIDDRDNVLAVHPTQTNLSPSTFNITFSAIPAFHADSLAKKYALDITYA